MNEVMIRTQDTMELSVEDVRTQVNKIQTLMTAIMKEGEHYGKIPGTNKPTLLKAGAEKLGFTFRLVPEFKITRNDMQNGHREYEIVCTLKHQSTDVTVGQGVGNCSTMESKYRYRNVADYEISDEPIPPDAKEKKQEYRKKGYGMKLIDGSWCWVKYTDTSRQENPDIADVYNTVLKMAKKRAHVDAMITACAASDIFIQDVEDFVEPIHNQEPPKATHPPQNNGNGKAHTHKGASAEPGSYYQKIVKWVNENSGCNKVGIMQKANANKGNEAALKQIYEELDGQPEQKTQNLADDHQEGAIIQEAEVIDDRLPPNTEIPFGNEQPEIF